MGNRQQTGIETERFVDRGEERFWSITIGDGKHPNGMVPCVDGSLLSRVSRTLMHLLVGAAMCSAC
jgi:hypothetical protein